MVTAPIVDLHESIVFLTTVNRSSPIYFHTQLTLIHLLPKSTHSKDIKNYWIKLFCTKKNLNLLFPKDIIQICIN